MKKISLSYSKSLRLNNVLKTAVLCENNRDDVGMYIEKIQSYIKTKGAKQIGPLIQYTKVVRRENESRLEIVLMFQCDKYIHSVEYPYSMTSVIQISNAMYCRYIGPEDKLKLANSKINLEAFENDIELEDYNYTIYVDRNEEDETIVADVFVPRKEAK